MSSPVFWSCLLLCAGVDTDDQRNHGRVVSRMFFGTFSRYGGGYLVKRSWALQGCNPARDDQARATKMVASPVTDATGLFLFRPGIIFRALPCLRKPTRQLDTTDSSCYWRGFSARVVVFYRGSPDFHVTPCNALVKPAPTFKCSAALENNWGLVRQLYLSTTFYPVGLEDQSPRCCMRSQARLEA